MAAKRNRREEARLSFSDSAALAYFMDCPLDLRITVTWDRCIHAGECREGHILGHPDKERCDALRDALWRYLHRRRVPFACIWVRDVGGGYGPHIHLALYWPLPPEELAWLLADLTGSLPSSARLPRDVVAQSECGGWQIKCNTAREEIPSALRWTGYLLDQEPRHLVMPALEGKILGVSRAIDARAVAPHRDALEAWKVRRGWRPTTAPRRAAVTLCGDALVDLGTAAERRGAAQLRKGFRIIRAGS